jgi:hypothetical protein
LEKAAELRARARELRGKLNLEQAKASRPMANESEARGGADRLDRAPVMIEARRQYQIVGLAPT